jgi:DHA3 family tetracycline resistance protein-like MFS transporter
VTRGLRIGALRPLRHRDFALMWAGFAASLLGDGVYLVAIAWQAYELSNTPAALSVVGVAWTLPTVLLLLAGGVVSDRRDRRRVMLLADAMRAVAVGAIAALSLAGVLELWELVVLVAVYGVGDALFLPAATAIVPSLVPTEEVVQANALEHLARPLMLRFAGPALGGAIIAVGDSAGAGFAFDAVTFLVSAACLAAMRPLPAPARAASGRSFRAAAREAREGLSYVRSQPWLWATLGAAALALLAFYGPLEVLLPYRIKNELELGAGTFGAVLAAAGISQVAVALAFGQHGLPRRQVTVMYVAWSAATLGVAFYALASQTWQLMAIGAAVGAFNGAGNIVWGTLMQTRVPARLLGRVSSVDWLMSTALIPVSFALTGPLAAALGTKTVLLGAGIAGAAASMAFLLIPGVRDPERVPA